MDYVLLSRPLPHLHKHSDNLSEDNSLRKNVSSYSYRHFQINVSLQTIRNFQTFYNFHRVPELSIFFCYRTFPSRNFIVMLIIKVFGNLCVRVQRTWEFRCSANSVSIFQSTFAWKKKFPRNYAFGTVTTKIICTSIVFIIALPYSYLIRFKCINFRIIQ